MNGVITQVSKGTVKPRFFWKVTCKSNVMTRLKRIFPKADKDSHGSVLLIDSPENCRDLAWFLERYPMVVSDKHLAKITGQSNFHKERETLVQGILAGKYQAGCAQMALPAREYQQQAADLVTHTGRLLLADDLGTGKTISAIAALATSGKLPALIVTLTHLPLQWVAELRRFTPHLQVHILKKATPYDFGLTIPDVIVTNYHKLSGWAQTLSEFVKAVIFDEIQELRRGDSSKYKAAQYIARAAEMRLGLSGTPIYNYGGEYFNVFDVLEEDVLGDSAEFHREWCTGYDEKAKVKDPRALGVYLRDQGLILRRTRKEVGRELPALSLVPYEIDSDKAAMQKVKGSAAELARILLTDQVLEKGARFKAGGQFEATMRQATGLAKATFVADFVRMLVDSGEKVVLFGWHHAVYKVWQEKLKDLGVAMYTGKESVNEKNASLDRFIKGNAKVIILSLRAGAGLNGLQHVSRTCVFGELDWSPAAMEQCVGRVYRDEQTDPVSAYFLHSNQGADPIMMDVLGVKKGQMEGTRDPDAPLVEAGVDPDHIKRLAEEFLAQVDGRKKTLPPLEPVTAPTVLPKAQAWESKRQAQQPDLFDEVAS